MKNKKASYIFSFLLTSILFIGFGDYTVQAEGTDETNLLLNIDEIISERNQSIHQNSLSTFSKSSDLNNQLNFIEEATSLDSSSLDEHTLTVTLNSLIDFYIK